MNEYVLELKNSWEYCKELYRTSQNKDLLIAFLEDFKQQLVAFHRNTMTSKYLRKSYEHLLDTFYVLWKKKGYISKIIDQLQHTNWNVVIQKQFDAIDRIVNLILAEYAAH